MKTSSICLLNSLVFVVVLWTAQCGLAAEMQFGFGKVDITPEKPVRLSGYGNRAEPSEGITQRIWARSLVVKVGDGPLHVLTSVDTIGFPGVLTKSIAQRLRKKHGITRERFVQCSTHSHATPHLADGLTNLFTTELTEEEAQNSVDYTHRLADQVVESVDLAVKSLAPATLAYGSGKVGFAVNRRVLKDGQWTRFGETLDGAVDHSLPVLKIVSPDGRLRGVVFNYACHCTTLGSDFNRVCGDWAGYASEYLEETHPGIVALSTIGCGADANPRPRGVLGMAEAHGRAVALEVTRLLKLELASIAAPLTPSFGYAGLPVDRPSLAELREQLTSPTPQYRRHAEYMLAVQKRMGRLPETYPMPIQTWSFGNELTMVFLGGEVVVDYAIRLHQELQSTHKWITAYANDVFGYVASERIRREGGYEVDRSMIYYNQAGPWAEGTEEVVISRVHEILKNPQSEGALSPQDALKSFHVSPGYEIELVASEPLVADPVSLAFGADGKLWVVEMADYPRGIDDTGKPGGRVRFLEDTDADGRFDKSTLFLDGLSYPTGVMPWRDGVLVSGAPEIIFARDTDGDGQADERRVLFSGLVEANPQHRVNGFAYGLDNWLHLGSGDSNGEILSTITGEKTNVSGRDFRIDPDRGLAEAVSGYTQYGRSRDDWGNWFGNNNSYPLWHYVLTDRYLRRNPYVAAPNPRVDLILPAPAPPVFPTSRTVDRFNDLYAANRFTSACSPMIFRDSTLGADTTGSAFVCEPVHNLVHRAVLQPDRITFRGERHSDEQTSEFLSSSDIWSRPVRVATGPDGALWVVDMYRHVIEHPQWIPEDWQKQLDLRAGSDMGRIYRVYRTGERPGALPNFSKLPTADLVARLESTNGWQRDTVQQLLVNRNKTESVPLLIDLYRTSAAPVTRLHALCTLDGMNRLPVELLTEALSDTHPGVLEQAIRLCESRLATAPQLGEHLLALVDHADVRVRFQLVLTLGEWADPRAGQAIGKIAVRDVNDPWMRVAVLSSAAPHADQALAHVITQPDRSEGWSKLTQDLITTALGNDPDGSLPRVLGLIADRNAKPVEPWQFAALSSFIDAIERRDLSLSKLKAGNRAELQTALDQVAGILNAARTAVSDQQADLDRRLQALGVVGRGFDAFESDRALLQRQLNPQAPLVLQEAAVTALAKTRASDVPQRLLANWKGHSPRLQAEILTVLLSRGEWTIALLNAVEDHTILAIDLDAATRSRLTNNRSAAIRQKAKGLLATQQSVTRQNVLDQYQSVGELTGNWLRGSELFSRKCATCHRFRARGNEIGPQLAALQDKSTGALLVAILDPNRAVEQKYRSYVAATTDGRLYDGLIIEESSTSVTLARPNGNKDVILRTDLEEFSSSGKSFMPEGLEKDLDPQAIADIIAFLQSRSQPLRSYSADEIRMARAAAEDAGVGQISAKRRTDPEPPRLDSWLGTMDVIGCSSADVFPSRVTWETRANPAATTVPGLKVFRIPFAMSSAVGSDETYELTVAGNERVMLKTGHADAAFASENGRVIVRFLAADIAMESTDSTLGAYTAGILEVELSLGDQQPGSPTSFALQAPETQNGTWMGVLVPVDR